jgi:hypothetical protein
MAILYCPVCSTARFQALAFREAPSVPSSPALPTVKIPTRRGIHELGFVWAHRPLGSPWVSSGTTEPTAQDSKDLDPGVSQKRRLGPVSLHGDYPPGIHKSTRVLIEHLRDQTTKDPSFLVTVDYLVSYLANLSTKTEVQDPQTQASTPGAPQDPGAFREQASHTLSSLTKFRCLERVGKGVYRVIPYLAVYAPSNGTRDTRVGAAE